MGQHFVYTPYLWTVLLSLAFLVAVDGYSWRHRQVPGARWFAISLIFGIIWVICDVVLLLTHEPALHEVIFKFRFIWPVPMMTGMFCFMLDYAGLGGRLTRRVLILLFAPAVLLALLIASSSAHSLVWTELSIQEGRYDTGIVGWLGFLYVYVLGLIGIGVFIWLFIRSPRHRWPVALCILAQVIVRSAFIVDLLNLRLFPVLELTTPAFTVSTALYALALFGFKMFDPIHLGRSTVIEQMDEGMLVLDEACRIVELNPAAERLLRQPAAALKGRPIEAVLPGCETLRQGRLETTRPGDLTYLLRLSPLQDQPDHTVGHLLLIEDITETRRARQQLLEKQRALAALQERTLLARELHDNAGQVLAYISLQAQAIWQLLQNGDLSAAQAQLERLAGLAQQGHRDLREDIRNLQAGSAEGWSFFSALEQHLDSYHRHYGIQTELELPADLPEATFDPEEGVQLLRVIQEALTNAHRHGGAHSVWVGLTLLDGRAEIVVADDGCGFDPAWLAGTPGDHLGLSFMRERMQQIGGSLTIDSQPGAGARVILSAPVKKNEPPSPSRTPS